MEITASSFRLRANAPEGQKAISYQAGGETLEASAAGRAGSAGDGAWLGTRHEFVHLSSPHDLLHETHAGAGGELSALLVGNPLFHDNAPLYALAEAAIRPRRPLESLGRCASRLPGTASRSDRYPAPKRSCASFAIFSGRQGSRSIHCMSGIEQHPIVHLATHSFYLSGQLAETVTGTSRHDPLQSSGIALAGATTTSTLWRDGKPQPASRDGFPLAAELGVCDLTGIDLMVPSACETAVGEVLANGESVEGLKRALALAGVNSSLLSLWPVDDKVPTHLTIASYQACLDGASPAEATVRANRAFLEEHDSDDGTFDAIPKLAPFICTQGTR